MKKALFFPLQVSLCTVSYLYASSSITHAQVTSDGTVDTQVTQDGNVAEITGGETRGSDLFHSFQDFSVPTSNEVFFNNANDISNIFSRVTGGNISNIDGLIRANDSANLFLINPAGIIFGQNARLDIGGSFYGSTASSILFEDGEFSAADLENPPLLTVNAPIGLGFRDNPGDIINRASTGNGLEVSSGETIALLGGNVTFDSGDIFALGADVEIGGIIESGTIEITENGNISFPESVLRGNVLLTNNSNVIVVGVGGTISVDSNNLELNSSSALIAGINSNPGFPNAQAGDIVISATGDVFVDGTDDIGSSNSSIGNAVFAGGIGNAGRIDITAQNISFTNGGLILSAIEDQGDTSDITLTARGDIIFAGIGNNSFQQSGILSSVDSDGVGNGGDINITAQNLFIRDRAIIDNNVSGIGSSGDIKINVENTIAIDGDLDFLSSFIESSVFFGEGDSGDIDITTNTLSLTNGGELSAGIFLGQGNAGNINIEAGTIALDGQGTRISSELFSITGNGNSGNIDIKTNSLSLTNAGRLTVSIDGEGNAGDINIDSESSVLIDGISEDGFSSIIEADLLEDATGNAGNININTPKLSLTNGGRISASTSGSGNAGNIALQSDLVEVTNNSFIFVDVLQEATGNGGNLLLEADKLVISDSFISAVTFTEGNAGNLTINVTDSIELSGRSEFSRAGLFASALEGSGNAGLIDITTNNLAISDGATIIVSNFSSSGATPAGTGQPGTINIQANSINLDTGGRIEAATQSELGEGANIDLQVAEDITLQGGSFISAQAINQGNGGNLSIDSRFIIAFPNGNNDILASAEQGQGGNITINAESLLGIEERTPSNLTNDINASSQVSGLDGTISISTPDTNPIQGATELPTDIIVPEETSQQACEANREIAAKNGFTIKGKGGIVPEPGLPLNSLNVIVNGETNSTSTIPQPIETSQGEIQPARGIKVTESGKVILTAYRTNNSGERIPEIKRNCG